jgi:uncharacterized membrane protein
MNRFSRILRHLAAPHWVVRRAFPRRTGDAVADAVRRIERAYDIELRVAVEGGMPPLALLRGKTSRARAHELFSQLGVWDTEHNCGVLVYVQFADRRIEIVADRGIGAKVKQSEWDAACAAMTSEFRAGHFEAGMLEGISSLSKLIRQHVPPAPPGKRGELPDRPAIL